MRIRSRNMGIGKYDWYILTENGFMFVQEPWDEMSGQLPFLLKQQFIIAFKGVNYTEGVKLCGGNVEFDPLLVPIQDDSSIFPGDQMWCNWMKVVQVVTVFCSWMKKVNNVLKLDTAAEKIWQGATLIICEGF